MKVDPQTVAVRRREGAALDRLGPVATHLLSQAGGIGQFGAYLEVLEPGAVSAERHWHEVEDEFLYMLEGEAVLIESGGETPLRPGDACCWPGGVADGHQVANRGTLPCRYLIMGTRPAADRCHYPDLGHTQIDDEDGWRVVEDATGRILRGGPPGRYDRQVPESKDTGERE
ncbi:cupin domain-containing protein [Salipiger sp.]|uniref:cupin domain-containing protein n=1 Tax=Salipiger sp. TaxID=2078585 RepID=UPI003A986FAC